MELFGFMVGVDVEEAIAVVGVILFVVDARSDKLELAFGCARIEETHFVGDVAAGFEQDVLAVAGAADAEVEAFVGFCRYQDRCATQSKAP